MRYRSKQRCWKLHAIIRVRFIFLPKPPRHPGEISLCQFLDAAIGRAIVMQVPISTSCGHRHHLRSEEGAAVFLAQVPVDFVGAVRHLKVFLQPSALDDESLILKTILWEGFSGAALRPWAVHAQRGPMTTIVGYTQADARQLNKRRALALPSVQAAVGEAI